MTGSTTEPRRWVHAADIPPGVTVRAHHECTSDTRARWIRDNAGQWTEYYPGSHPRTITAEEMDRRAGTDGYIETGPAPWMPAPASRDYEGTTR